MVSVKCAIVKVEDVRKKASMASLTNSNNLTVTSASHWMISCSLNGKIFTSLCKLWHQHLHANASQLSWQYLKRRSTQRDIPCTWELQLWCHSACQCFWPACAHVKFIIILRIAETSFLTCHCLKFPWDCCGTMHAAEQELLPRHSHLLCRWLSQTAWWEGF